MIPIPDFLSHYYDAERGPFLSLSDLALDEAQQILARLRQQAQTFASQRTADCLAIRRDLEEQVRQKFMAKGGLPQRHCPHYLILGSCPWLKGWYRDGREIRIPLAAVDPAVVSFTYGDTFPAMRFGDGKPYRKQVYTVTELPDVLREFGLPQEWNSLGQYGPDRYIEAQVWADEPVRAYTHAPT